MSARSHPSATRLLNFATGHLPMAPAITVSAHVDGCESCRARISAFEHAEGRRMELSAPAPMSHDALECLLARAADDPAAQSATAPPSSEFLGDVRLPRAAANTGFRRRRWLTAGLWAARMNGPRDAEWRTFLLRAPAGTRIPNHEHHGAELIAVLSGSLRDSGTFGAGDFVENDFHVHEMVVSQHGPCACLISTQGPIKWRGWNRLIGVALGV